MSRKETVLGTSKVDPRNRITLVQPIPDLLNVKVGDIIVFVTDDEGNIMIRASKLPQPYEMTKRKKRP